MTPWLLTIVPVFMAALLAASGWTLKELVRQGKDLAIVKKEVLPNSGTSLRDVVHRVETDIAVLKDRGSQAPNVTVVK